MFLLCEIDYSPLTSFATYFDIKVFKKYGLVLFLNKLVWYCNYKNVIYDR